MKLDRVEAILQVLNSQGHVSVVRVRGDGYEVRAKRGPYAAAPPAATPEPEAPEEVRRVVFADRVGIFRADSTLPQMGERVERGTVLGVIESIRIRNPLQATQEGYVVEVRVEDGEPVEYGQTLFVLAEEAPPADDLL